MSGDVSGDAGGEGRAKELPFRRFSGEGVAANGASANVQLYTNSRPPPTAPDRARALAARARHAVHPMKPELAASPWGKKMFLSDCKETPFGEVLCQLPKTQITACKCGSLARVARHRSVGSSLGASASLELCQHVDAGID